MQDQIVRKAQELMCSEQEKVRSNLDGPNAEREITRFALDPLVSGKDVDASMLVNLCIKSTFYWWSLRQRSDVDNEVGEDEGAVSEDVDAMIVENGSDGIEMNQAEEEKNRTKEGSEDGDEDIFEPQSARSEMLTMFKDFIARLLAKKFLRIEDDGFLTLSPLASSMAMVNFNADEAMVVDEEIQRQFKTLVMTDLHLVYLLVPFGGTHFLHACMPEWKLLLRYSKGLKQPM